MVVMIGIKVEIGDPKVTGARAGFYSCTRRPPTSHNEAPHRTSDRNRLMIKAVCTKKDCTREEHPPHRSNRRPGFALRSEAERR